MPDPLLLLLVLPAAASLVVFGLRVGYQETARQLRAFLPRLRDGELHLDQGLIPRLGRTWLSGRFDGRSVRLHFPVEGPPDRQVRCETTITHPAAPFAASRAGGLGRLGRWLGAVAHVPMGDRVDQKFILRGPPEALARLFRQEPMEEALDALFQTGLGVRSVALRGPTLGADLAGAGSLETWRLERVFAALTRIAELCERREVRVSVLGERRHFAWTGGGSAPRCPYCHDELDLERASPAALALCPECGTVHHEDCLAEAGGCAVFGCAGGAPRRPAGPAVGM